MYKKNNLFQLSDLIPVYNTHTHIRTSSIQHLPAYADPEDLWDVTACVQYWRNLHRVPEGIYKRHGKNKELCPISAKLFHAAALEPF